MYANGGTRCEASNDETVREVQRNFMKYLAVSSIL